MVSPRIPILDRIHSFTLRDKLVGCHLWSGARNEAGYGMIGLNGTMFFIHRISWEIENGKEIPNKMVIDHLCRNPSCFNPKHLEVVSHKENTLRGIGPTAQNADRMHCKNGHLLIDENCYPSGLKAGVRRCKMCGAKSNAKARAKRTLRKMAIAS